MKTRILLLVAIVVVICLASTLSAQDPSKLLDKLEQLTGEKEPSWKLDRKLPAGNLLVLRWSSGEARIFISLTATDSTDQAKQTYKRSLEKLNEQLGPKGTKAKLDNFGAENQLWTGYRDDDPSAAMVFRQERTHVLLFAPSEDVARRFAGYVLQLLQPSKSAQTKQIEAPQDWKEFSSTDGGFSVLFPGTPKEETQTIEAAPGVRFNLRIHKVQSPAECSVMYADYPIPVGDPDVARNVLDNGAKGAVASVGSELLELKEITHDGYPGRFLKERMPRGEIMRVKMLLVDQRMYQIAITTPREEGEPDKRYQTMADKFLGSFKLLKTNQKTTARR